MRSPFDETMQSQAEYQSALMNETFQYGDCAVVQDKLYKECLLFEDLTQGGKPVLCLRCAKCMLQAYLNEDMDRNGQGCGHEFR